MIYFISHNIKKFYLMDDERIQFILEYIKARKGLSFEEKILELYDICLNDDLTNISKFSDGVNIKSWLSDNKQKLDRRI